MPSGARRSSQTFKTVSRKGTLPELFRETSRPTYVGSMVSQGHPNHPYSGGPWFQSNESTSYGSQLMDWRDKSDGSFLSGNVFLEDNARGWSGPRPTYTPLSESKMRQLGTAAIAQTEPTQSPYSLSTALGELRNDGIPSIIGSSYFRDWTREGIKFKKLGRYESSEYLAWEFGWRPMIADLKSLIMSVERSDDIMRQYNKDSGNKVRRRLQLAGSSETVKKSHDVQGAIWPADSSYSGTVRCNWTVSHKSWFSGAYKYYVPEWKQSTEVGKIANMVRKVHGLELTPEVVWNLSPWSWAIDWHGNIGDVMHNASALGRDGLVLEYGYVMSSAIETRDYGAAVSYKGQPIATLNTHYVRKTQRRVSASPYGFNVAWEQMNPKQLTIVTALGLSKGTR